VTCGRMPVAALKEQARAEAFRPAQGFDRVTARAFASVGGILDSCAHLVRPGGRLLAMKGDYPAAELAEVAPRCGEVRVLPLSVPGLAQRRHVVIMEPLVA